MQPRSKVSGERNIIYKEDKAPSGGFMFLFSTHPYFGRVS
jgi:hypothetical protein